MPPDLSLQKVFERCKRHPNQTKQTNFELEVKQNPSQLSVSTVKKPRPLQPGEATSHEDDVAGDLAVEPEPGASCVGRRTTCLPQKIWNPNTNVEPKKKGLEDEFSFSDRRFSGSILVFGGVGEFEAILGGIKKGFL